MVSRIKITAELRNAVMRAIDEAGSQSELSRRSGVPQKNISNYISMANRHMNNDSYQKLLPFLIAHLKSVVPSENLQREQARFRAECSAVLTKKILECSELPDSSKFIVIKLINQKD